MSAEITPRGIWLGAGSNAQCFVARRSGALDQPALEVELQRLRGDDRSSIAISAVRGVTYQELVAVMDMAIKVGLIDVGIDTAEIIGVAFNDTAAGRATAPAHCPSPPKLRPKPAAPAAHVDPSLLRLTRPPPAAEMARRKELLERTIPLPPPPKPDYANTPVVIVTTTEMTLGGQHISPVASIADGKGVIQPLLIALEQLAHDNTATGPRQLIIQADAALDAVVIERVCASSRAAGYSDLLFAVKQTARSQ